VLGIVALLRRPETPKPGPPTLDLGPEPPAIVNFLANGFRVTRDAVPATLLDLAARNALDLEHRGPDQFVCRLRPDPGGLTPYEEQVMRVLRDNQRDGIVPPGALTTGTSDEASKWWTEFKKAVMADSQQRGLSRPLLDKKVSTRLFVASWIPSLFVGLVFSSWGWGLGWAAGAFLLLGYVLSLHTQRETPAGLEAASRWLGVRTQLAQDAVFPTLPPVTVELWERHLSYGAALGVAHGAVEPLGMGAESDSHAWSSYGEGWRPVHIVYPQYFGWGMHPLLALLKYGLIGAGAALAIYLLAAPVADNVSGRRGVLLVVLLIVLPIVVAVVSLSTILRALSDLFGSPAERTGPVLRLRKRGDDDNHKYFVAVDDGRSPKIRAWPVKYELYTKLHQRELVTASVTPRLGHVRSITPADA
jgi:hypothetical protein